MIKYMYSITLYVLLKIVLLFVHVHVHVHVHVVVWEIPKSCDYMYMCWLGSKYTFAINTGLRANMKRAFNEIQPSFFEDHGIILVTVYCSTVNTVCCTVNRSSCVMEKAYLWFVFISCYYSGKKEVWPSWLEY